MKEFPSSRIASALALIVAGWCASLPISTGASNIYATGFEEEEGYNINFSLDGQADWTSEGSGGNGLVFDAFPGLKQQGYIGNFPPSPGFDYLFLWKPLDLDPVPNGTPILKFSTEMSIMAGTGGEPDEFIWTAFNSQFLSLFVINFENYAKEIYYRVEGGSYVPTGLTYTNGIIYTLSVTMDFTANRWSASLDNRLITTNQPLVTSFGALTNVTDIDAGWLVYDVDQPCDNYMLFDNFTLTPLPQVSLLKRAPNGHVTLRTTGKEGWKMAVEASTNLTTWTALTTNTVAGGQFDYIDTGAASLPRRYYRTRLVP